MRCHTVPQLLMNNCNSRHRPVAATIALLLKQHFSPTAFQPLSTVKRETLDPVFNGRHVPSKTLSSFSISMAIGISVALISFRGRLNELSLGTPVLIETRQSR